MGERCPCAAIMLEKLLFNPVFPFAKWDARGSIEVPFSTLIMATTLIFLGNFTQLGTIPSKKRLKNEQLSATQQFLTN